MRKFFAITLIVMIVVAFKLGMYEVRRYLLSDPAPMAAPGPDRVSERARGN